jgi:hypothetical protein
MTHEHLQRPRIHAAARERISGTVAQHMHMNRKFDASSLAKPLDKLLDAVDGQRRSAFAEEQEAAMLAVLVSRSSTT